MLNIPRSVNIHLRTGSIRFDRDYFHKTDQLEDLKDVLIDMNQLDVSADGFHLLFRCQQNTQSSGRNLFNI